MLSNLRSMVKLCSNAIEFYNEMETLDKLKKKNNLYIRIEVSEGLASTALHLELRDDQTQIGRVIELLSEILTDKANMGASKVLDEASKLL